MPGAKSHTRGVPGFHPLRIRRVLLPQLASQTSARLFSDSFSFCTPWPYPSEALILTRVYPVALGALFGLYAVSPLDSDHLTMDEKFRANRAHG